MALSHLFGSRRLKTLKDSLLEAVVLYADVLFQPADRKRAEMSGKEGGIVAPLSPPLRSLSQHLVAEILAMSHDMCFNIPEEVLIAGGLILEDRIDRRDETFMTLSYHYNTVSVSLFESYEKNVAKLRIANGMANREETIRKIASLIHCLKDVEVNDQPLNPRQLNDLARRVERNGPLLKLVRLKVECDRRSLPFRFDHESLRVLEIKTGSGFKEWQETISKCTNLMVLSLDFNIKNPRIVVKLINSLPPNSKLRILRLPQTKLSEEVLQNILFRLASLELLEARSVLPSRATYASEPKKKLKIFLCRDSSTFQERNLVVDSLAQIFGSNGSVDDLLTFCEYTQDQRLFYNAFTIVMGMSRLEFHERTCAEEVARIERAALVAAKIDSLSNYEILEMAERFQFSDEFMLRMSFIVVSRCWYDLAIRSGGLGRFIVKFVREHEGCRMARWLKERYLSLDGNQW